jgi:hypothetical protein
MRILFALPTHIQQLPSPVSKWIVDTVDTESQIARIRPNYCSGWNPKGTAGKAGLTMPHDVSLWSFGHRSSFRLRLVNAHVSTNALWPGWDEIIVPAYAFKGHTAVSSTGKKTVRYRTIKWKVETRLQSWEEVMRRCLSLPSQSHRKHVSTLILSNPPRWVCFVVIPSCSTGSGSLSPDNPGFPCLRWPASTTRQ